MFILQSTWNIKINIDCNNNIGKQSLDFLVIEKEFGENKYYIQWINERNNKKKTHPTKNKGKPNKDRKNTNKQHNYDFIY